MFGVVVKNKAVKRGWLGVWMELCVIVWSLVNVWFLFSVSS